MSIKEVGQKIKRLVERAGEREKDIFLVLVVVLMAFGGFGLGRLSALETTDEPVRIERLNLDALPAGASQAAAISIVTEKKGRVTAEDLQVEVEERPQATGKVVASKNGTKYHLPECSGAKRIKEENKIWFDSITEAQKAGYTAAANCPGL